MSLPVEPGSKGPLISIVDDETGFREALVSLLRSAGYATADFATAESFLASPAAHRARCLILDLHLPGMSGLDLQQRLPGRLPIIFISAHAEARQKEQAISAGAIAFLGKPFQDQRLLDALASAIG